MKIKEIRTRVVRWKGETVPLPPHFCTNPMDLLSLPEASMQTFTFHGWLVVEIFTDDGLVGIGNAALAPQVTKQVIDLYLKPLLLGADPWDIEMILAAHVPQDNGIWPQGHRHGRHQRGRHRAVGCARQIGQAACVSPAWRKNEIANSSLREPTL